MDLLLLGCFVLFVIRYVAWMVFAVITANAKPKTPTVNPIAVKSVMREIR